MTLDADVLGRNAVKRIHLSTNAAAIKGSNLDGCIVVNLGSSLWYVCEVEDRCHGWV